MPEPMVCTPKRLPDHLVVAAAETAVDHNPANAPPVMMMALVAPTRERLAVMTTKYWGAKGVKLTVSFLDGPSAGLRTKLMDHLNAWGTGANVKFVQTTKHGQVRIARGDGPEGGYWSYLGTDILSIPVDQPTMNLEAFVLNTPASEYRRVVRHEAGHTLGFPHEHARRALVELLDVAKVLEYFQRTQGWSEADVRAQVLTPLEEASLGEGSSCKADAQSIMSYQIPGFLTLSGQPILGGTDINRLDRAVVAKLYPKKGAK